MMISPEFYVNQYKNTPYKELIEARTELINKLSNLENYFETPQTETIILIFPNEDTQYKMYLESLQSLIAMMIERVPELTGTPYIDLSDENE